MDFQVIVDSVELNDEPLELREWVDEAAFDRDINTVLLNFPSQLTFKGDGYELLLNRFEEIGYISELTILINFRDNAQSPWRELHNGLIFLSSSDYTNSGEFRCRITDNSFNARIRVNQDVKGYVNTRLSKNGQQITPAANLRLDLFAAATGTYTSNYAAYDLLVCLNWMAQFLSDGTMTVESDYYDSLDTTVNNTTDLKKIAIITGEEIKQINSGFAPHVSWRLLSEFMTRTFALVVGVVRNSTGGIEIRFEPESYWEDSAIVHIENIPDIQTSINSSLLYSAIEVGSRHFVKDENSADSYPLPLIPSYTNSLEQYYIAGIGNTGGTLDLSTEISTDTNAIYELFELGTQDNFDDVIFAIEYWDNSSDIQAMKAQYYDSNYVYNQHLTTGEILNRHRFFGNVTSEYGDDDDKCTAINTNSTYEANDLTTQTGTTTIEPFLFNNDYAGFEILGWQTFPATVSDPNNNWGNGTIQGNPVSAANSRYTVPAPGYYGFAYRMMFNVIREQNQPLALFLEYGVKRYNSSNTLIETFSRTLNIGFEQGAPSSDFIPAEDFAPLFCQSGDYIQAFAEITWTYIFAPSPSYDSFAFSAVAPVVDIYGNSQDFWTNFQCLNTNNGGGIIAPGDYRNYPAILDEFEVPIDQDTWDLIKNNLSSGINFSGRNTTKRLGFIESIEHVTDSQSARFRLRRKPNNT